MSENMCGASPPISAKIATKDKFEVKGEGSGSTTTSSSGFFVLSIEHLHGGGAMLVLAVIFVLGFVVTWCCARRRVSAKEGERVQREQQMENGGSASVSITVDGEKEAEFKEGQGAKRECCGKWTPGWRPS